MLGEYTVDENRVQTGPSGRPFAFGMDGKPATLREAAELLSDMERRTLRKTDIRLPSGAPALVRTLCLVYDDDLATCSDSELRGYEPQVFASACYWGEDMRECVLPLWRYASPEEAQAAHPEAVDEFVSGRARVAA